MWIGMPLAMGATGAARAETWRERGAERIASDGGRGGRQYRRKTRIGFPRPLSERVGERRSRLFQERSSCVRHRREDGEGEPTRTLRAGARAESLTGLTAMAERAERACMLPFFRRQRTVYLMCREVEVEEGNKHRLLPPANAQLLTSDRSSEIRKWVGVPRRIVLTGTLAVEASRHHG